MVALLEEPLGDHDCRWWGGERDDLRSALRFLKRLPIDNNPKLNLDTPLRTEDRAWGERATSGQRAQCNEMYRSTREMTPWQGEGGELRTQR